VNDDGIVSGWSRELAKRGRGGEPRDLDGSDDVVPLLTVPGQADGIAEARTAPA
jgi:hypothetical protein